MQNQTTVSRRAFVSAGAFAIIRPELVRGSQRNSAVRMALFGCGGRGTGVASSFSTVTAAQYVALGDLFQEQTERSQSLINTAASKAGKAPINSGMLFHGLNSLERLLALKEVDAIHIATPPYFHPEHLEACVAAGRHVYMEKPVAVDVPGAKRVMRAGERAKGKTTLAVGFQLRHATPYVQLVERVRQGAIGEMVCGLAHYYASALPQPDRPGAGPALRRLRNWLHDRILSGDILVEQNIHLIDVNNWIAGSHPVSAQGTGGRAGRQDQGDCWGHYNVNYTYPGNVHITLTSTQFGEGGWDVAMRYFGTLGAAEMHYDAPVRITGPRKWEFPLGSTVPATETAAAVVGAFKGALDDADAMKQKRFIESIVSGRFINEAEQGAESTLSAILGRQAAYTGRIWTWQELLKLEERWDARLNLASLV
ncbi:MAG: Gfo/Idh/MocA family oxidoreductase [Bryobacterales bacterium]|nr:Gfo/Idh/MocA family oxidoreductase [Bryobacterales bacterium]